MTPQASTPALRNTLPLLLPHLVRNAVDPPATRSRAWPGAGPFLSGPQMAQQIGIFDVLSGIHPVFSSDRIERFDPTAFHVRRIRGRGVGTTVKQFLSRYHYLGKPSAQGPVFAMYANRSNQLVGIATFGRSLNPAWGRGAFQPTEADLEHLKQGAISPEALANRLVDESSYMDLTRFCILPREETDAPLGRGEGDSVEARKAKGAATWFLSWCLYYFMQRNRALWAAQTMRERGLDLSVKLADAPLRFSRREIGFDLPGTALDLLEEAQLGDDTHGTGFVKVIHSLADPTVGHVGHIYQVLRMYYGGRTTDEEGSPEEVAVGLRSGEVISQRRITKAANPAQDGHATAALRLAWEGAQVTVEVLRSGQIVSEERADWIRSIPALADSALDDEIASRWRAYQTRNRARFGDTIDFRLRYDAALRGGLREASVPSKHRYLKPLGTAYWGREVLLRCKHLRPDLLAEERAWSRMSRGPRPDCRDRHGYYPRANIAEPARQVA